jgi:O-antigen ligase
MRAAATSGVVVSAAPPRRGASLVRFRDRLTFVAILASFFVMVEPSPNEVIVSIGLLLLLATGVHLPRLATPLLWMLLGLNIGGAFSALPVIGKEKVALFVVISVFLMAYCIFFLILFSENTLRRLELMRTAWIIGAVIAAAAGIVGYFNLFGTRELFTLYASRAKGTFNDPNVFGPYLVLPLLLLMQGFITRTARRPVLATLALIIIVVGLFLSFSRAAWMHAALSAALLVYLTFITTGSTWQRARILGLVLGGGLVLATALVALAVIPDVRDMLLLRANLAQDHDLRYGGRFDNYWHALAVIFDNPNGIGPFEFGRRFGEDPHNAYLHTFVAYGWLGGMCYLALVATTLWIGWKHVWARTPYQPFFLAILSTYTVLAAVSLIIHSDHWRHYFLLVALVWALAAATRRHLDALRPPRAATRNGPVGV